MLNLRSDWWRDHGKAMIRSCLTCPNSGVTGLREENDEIIIEGTDTCNFGNEKVAVENWPEIPCWCPKIKKPKIPIPSNSTIDSTRVVLLGEFIPIEEIELTEIISEPVIPLPVRLGWLSEEAQEIVNLIFRSPMELVNDMGDITRQTLRAMFVSRKWSHRKVTKAFDELREFVNSF